MEPASRRIPLDKVIAYAAPSAGAFFFYIPMWSILPGIYSKHFGLPLRTVAAVVLILRIFDGAMIPFIGYLSDRHHAAGGSRKPWVVTGYLGVVIACYFLFQPPQPATAAYYLLWSLIYFLAFMVGDIPHATWGNELTLEYQERSRIFGIRTFIFTLGTLCFYSLPLLPVFPTSDYTPGVLKGAIYIGGVMMIVGLTWALLSAPTGVAVRTTVNDSMRSLLRSLFLNKPFQAYVVAFTTTGVAYGMWFGLVFFYLDGYLGHGSKVAMIFLLANVVSAASTPLLLKGIGKTSKSTAWAAGLVLFIAQSIGAALLSSGNSWWVGLTLVLVAHLSFNCHNIAAISILGDIADYGRWKFRKDRTATYFSVNSLLFQVAVGLGSGLALAIAGQFGFKPSAVVHTSHEVRGLKLGFAIVPLVLAFLALPIIWRTPLTRHRHRIIQTRLESRLIDQAKGWR